ncbi:glycosyltransferase [Fibrobacter intestinalis]|uniref:Glycosyltransferase involved in cell wall bisynthesis n=1 Tax=Fibrobacter intestinalis TaxID=28122 RepID=A0A1T4QQM0_9BACT|nr:MULTISPECIES: glycosyltransferase [Fibrobacter]PBC73334.1 glycosyltransferase involved in cell wall bisynthesis [Fibrobacter sp. NR9]SKA06069.1 Glycosyltransferase involved in cell wall bisynthesis [Fibrobacter intestinalis]
MKKILIFPEPKMMKGNFYLLHLSKILANKYQILDSSKSYFKNLLICDFILLNWFESIKNQPLLLIKRLFFLFFAFCSRKKIVWTLHNKIPHEGRCLYSQIVIFLLLRFSWKIHILCKESYKLSFLKGFETKCVLIPHGDYFGDFKSNGLNLHDKYKLHINSKIILFTGAIKPYKNIELLISAFNSSSLAKYGFTLLIRGNCLNNEYSNRIKNLSEKKECVIFDPTFIPTNEMYDYLDQSICLVAPYNNKSTLNSGTLWMALSYKKTIIIPEIGSIKDIPEFNSILYTYTYQTEDEHEKRLKEVFIRLKEDIFKSADCLLKKGGSGFKYMEKNSWEKQKENWINLFS